VITFAYPFANPAATTSEAAREYRSIFNIINENDMPTLLPPEIWGFTRFGTDVVGSVIPDYLEKFRTLQGTPYIYYQNLDYVMEAFVNQVAPNREALYLFDDKVYFASEYFATRQEAEDEQARLKRPFIPEMLQFVKFYIYESDDGEGYRVVIYQTPAFILQVLAAVASSGTHMPAHQRVSIAESFIEPAEAIATAFATSLRHSHSAAAYYIIIRQQ